MSTLKTFATRACLLGFAALMLPACVSNDSRRFESTVTRPTTVRIVQAMTGGAVVWEKEIPVQHSLVVNLDREGEFEWIKVNPEKPATSFHWSLFNDRNHLVDSAREDLPNLPIRLEVAIRPSPEWPEGYLPPGAEEQAVPVEVLERPAPTEVEQPEAPAEEVPAEEAPAEEAPPAEAPPAPAE